eukprot:XP_023157154.1 disheveled-associated activator of morphogenesis 1-like [Zea mays]
MRTGPISRCARAAALPRSPPSTVALHRCPPPSPPSPAAPPSSPLRPRSRGGRLTAPTAPALLHRHLRFCFGDPLA